MVNSKFLNGMEFSEALQKTMDYIEKNGKGKRIVNYHLRDWLISRQRYWGPPIPMVNCPKCGWNPVPENQLPVLLPDIKDFKPTGDGLSPLQKAPKSWLETDCPKMRWKGQKRDGCQRYVLRQCMVFLKYPSIGKKQESPWDLELTKKWLPVDVYIGGAEHAVLHLLYARFVWMCFKDWGYLKEVDSTEPFPFLFLMV